jgi:hypothetical protein
MAQAVSRRPPSAHVGSVADKVALGHVSRVLRFYRLSIILPLFCQHLAPPEVVCNSPEQAAHLYTLGSVGASSQGWKCRKYLKVVVLFSLSLIFVHADTSD